MSQKASDTKRQDKRFILTAALLMGAFLLLYREEFLGRWLAPWVDLTAQITLAALHLAGIEATRAATQIQHPGGFAYEIYYRCTGILPAAGLTILVIASSGSVRRKIGCLAAGIPALLALNLIRLVHLFHLGVRGSAAFGPAHDVFWEAVSIAATLGIWWWWRKWPPGFCFLKKSPKVPARDSWPAELSVRLRPFTRREK
jgi:exosortase/archaeosortase family protein